ncbi:MAG: YceI family protein [Thioalkalivibrio sp.]|nr:YceI family protein [Thioalkalivibrio sp.]
MNLRRTVAATSLALLLGTSFATTFTYVAGEAEVLIPGELTIQGATWPATWTTTIAYRDDGAHVQARTTFPFENFGLTKPRVASVLSVADEITLELDAVVIAVPEG